MPYEITGWSTHFENNRTREIKHMRWIPLPNKHDGEGFTELIAEDDKGPEDYAAWVLLVQVASKCTPRGHLVKPDGAAITPQGLARKTRAPAAIFEHAIPRLVKIGWLKEIGTACEIPAGGCGKKGEGCAVQGTEQQGTEGNRKEKNKGTGRIPAPFVKWGNKTGVPISLIAKTVHGGYEPVYVLGFLMMQAGDADVKKPAAYFRTLVKSTKPPPDRFYEQAKVALADVPVAGVDWGALLKTAEREPTLAEKKAKALAGLRE